MLGRLQSGRERMAAAISDDYPQRLIWFQDGGMLVFQAWLPNRHEIKIAIHCDDVLCIPIIEGPSSCNLAW